MTRHPLPRSEELGHLTRTIRQILAEFDPNLAFARLRIVRYVRRHITRIFASNIAAEKQFTKGWFFNPYVQFLVDIP